jgi:hypothetical protein
MQLMAPHKDRLVTAKYLSDWTLVRLPDGQVGVLTKQGGSCRVTFATRSGVAVPPDTELEVIKHPAELAMEALITYNVDAKQDP